MMQTVVNNIQIATSKLREAKAVAEKEGEQVPVELDEAKTQQTVNIAECGPVFLHALLNTDLTKNQRMAITAQAGDRTEILEQVVTSPLQLGRVLKPLQVPDEPTVEIQVGGRWYPVPVVGIDSGSDPRVGQWCSFAAQAKVVDQSVQQHAGWNDTDFRTEDGQQRRRTVRELLQEAGIRIADPANVEKQNRKLARMAKFSGKHGDVMAVKGSVLGNNSFLWMRSLEAIPLGTEARPRQLILEPDLEVENRHTHGYYGYNRNQEFDLPFVRAFSTDLKRYVYVDVDDISPWEFDGGAMDRLVLPQEMREILSQVFNASMDQIFGDLFKGRHGGMILLANGPQGVGKTLTAEVFAEHTKRPLYVLEMGELGTNLADVEKSLQRVFARAARWNAVLLFDEADVFLAKRAEADLERSAIVGVFLRLLDRYEGMFFLTTNREEVIDPAFRSRITLKLDYPELPAEARKRIWENMLQAAGFEVEGDLSPVAEEKIDGRQIRNQVRLLRVIHRNGRITAEQVAAAMRFVAKN